MLKENWRLVSRVERFGDFLIIIASFFVAYYGRHSLVYWDKVFGWQLPFSGPVLAPVKDYFIVLLVALAGYAVVLHQLGAYSSMRFGTSFRLLWVSLFSSAIVFILLAATLFLLKIDVSRSFIGIFCLLVGLLLSAERFLVLEFLRFWRRRGWNFRNIIICGVGEQARRLAVSIVTRPELGIRIRAFSDLRPEVRDQEAEIERFKTQLRSSGVQAVGRIIRGVSVLQTALKEYAIDEVIFTDVVEVMPQVEESILICSEQGVRTTIAADLFSIGMVKSGLSYFGETPLIHFQTPPGDRWELSVKRTLDVLVSAVLMVVLAPFFVLLALAIKLDDPGPVIFAQRRVGLNGRLFAMYKFRSMHRDAEQEQAQLREKNEMAGPVFKIKDDPRITSVGRVLRRFSLDELPQLWNVFIGDMSLVGPRPPVPTEVQIYERRYRRRLSMRPGLTCTWQVSGRNEIKDFDAWVKLDLEYIDNWSLGRDLGLLFRTVPAVLFGTGAR